MARGDAVDVDAFLARPLVARLATDGPTVRPVWFLWEDGALWWLTDTGSALARRVEAAGGAVPVAVVVDDCDLATGMVVAITLSGPATFEPLDVVRARRKLAKYLGPDESGWDAAIAASLDLPTTRLGRLVPDRIVAKDMSFSGSSVAEPATLAPEKAGRSAEAEQ